MTQTIYVVTENRTDYIEMDVYMHPNRGKTFDLKEDFHNSMYAKDAKYRFSIFADLNDLIELKDCVEGLADCKGSYWYDSMLDCYNAATTSGATQIWRCGADNGHDDYDEWFLSRADAEKSLFEQTC